ncbi:Fatty acid oxidation complex subunit alpha [Streptomyces sp. RB17]|uniref:enoyl-CoA hydratase/isomerase family protein n=1 Tax=Streptomyces sp. RB17 TaxID=2585197 RepID=UPI0012959C33|nr:enoyl-CoA hydratase/isomerase family protein [Streptomyces sp. RB17]MQY40634.1 Fatty acid oxidation complex subunit alpha [Streptomyces sp. RB17]
MTAHNRLTITKVTPTYWTVLIDNPPINLYDPEMFAELNVLLDTLDSDKEVKVVVLESANPDYFVAHFDFVRADIIPDQPGSAEFTAWPRMMTRFAESRVISIAKIRGRARGQGSELAFACDMRFASKEKAILGQPEVGVGVVPGGGGTEWVSRLAGRARAIEILCGADDFDADTAEKYNWINRSIPDSELDEFVDRLARRVASFLPRPLELAKKLINTHVGFPSEAELWNSNHAFLGARDWPASQARVKRLLDLGFMQSGDMEENMGERLGETRHFVDLPPE